MKYEPPLDPLIASAVGLLVQNGIETFESCEGGERHAYTEPTIRFHGGIYKGYQAVTLLLENGHPLTALRRAWMVIDNELDGPFWEVTFSKAMLLKRHGELAGVATD